MNTTIKAELFSRAFSRYGSRLDTSKDHYMNDILVQCQEAVSNGHTMDIYFDFIDNQSVNAVATKYEGAYYIGIFSGTIQVFNYLSRKIAAHPKILIDFGDPSTETNTNKSYNAIIQNAIHIIEEDTPAIPNSEERMKLGELIFQQSVLNILFHELAHIVNGHIDFLQLSGLSYLEETQIHPGNLTPKRSLDRQTLEIDADAFSARRTLAELLWIFDCDESRWKSVIPSYRSLFKLWSFVRFMCWRIMEKSYVGENLLAITHPPTAVRHHCTRIACSDLVQLRGRNVSEQYEASFVLGVSDADEAFRLLSELDPISPPLSVQLSNLQFTHGAILFCHWDALRGILMEFATSPLREANIYDNNLGIEIKRQYEEIISDLSSNW